MVKMIPVLSVVATAAVAAVPATTLADTTVISSPEINTARGNTQPMTDPGDLSRKNPRNFVDNPTGLSAAASMGVGLGEAYGLGFGARAGYTIPARVYFGALFGYHLGTTAETMGVSVSNRTWHIGPEAGYDFGIGKKLLLRPVAGLAFAFNKQSTDIGGGTTSDTATRMYFAPGASLVYPVGNFFFGADSRAMIGTTNPTMTFMGTAGAHL